MDNKQMMEFYQRFWNPSLEVLSNMEQEGVYLDTEFLERNRDIALDEVAALEEELVVWSRDYSRQIEEPVNWNSPAQVLPFIHDFKGYEISPVTGNLSATKRNKKKARTTSEAALHYFADNAKSATDRLGFKTLLQAKTTRKLAQFMEKLPKLVSPDGRLRCSIGPSTDTGRLNCSNPNLQQIPSRNDKFGIRKAFRAPEGKLLVVADFSQLEMYIIAHFLIYWFNDYSLYDDLSSGDVHTNTAFRVWGPELRALGATPENIKEVGKSYRGNAKTFNYAVAYGKTADGLGAQIKDEHGKSIGKVKAQELLDIYFAAYPGLEKLFERWRAEARETGFVRTLLGRTRPLPDAAGTEVWARRAAERRAVNTPVQGSAADVVTAAMLNCNITPLSCGNWINKTLQALDVRLILQVHDELIFEVPEENAVEAAAEIDRAMSNPFEAPLKVQLKVDVEIAKTWLEGK